MCESRIDNCEECNQRRWLKTAATVALCLWGANFVVALVGTCLGKGADFGQLGDCFGMVNALFSSVAVAGAVYAIVLQQREMTFAREEARGARAEGERNFKTQSKIAEIQGATAILSAVVHEMDFLQKRHAKIHELSVRVTRFSDSHFRSHGEGEIRPDLKMSALGLIHDAEAMDLLPVSLHLPSNPTQNLIEEFGNLQTAIQSASDTLNDRRIKLLNRRREITTRLEILIAASE